jgi:hypothetical protein
VQGLLSAVVPDKYKGAVAVKVIKAIDPVGLGAHAVDSVGTLVTYAITGKDEGRLNRLVDRMKEGPGRVFAELGEDMGDALYDIHEMSDAEFNEFMSIRSFGNWVKYLATGKMPGETAAPAAPRPASAPAAGGHVMP